MRLIQGSNNVDTMLKMYREVARAPEVEVRGSKTRSVMNMAMVFAAHEPVITSFVARKFSLDYAKKEWLWYLRADRLDSSIEEHATIWKKLKQEDGSYYSNYGQYIFHREPVAVISGSPGPLQAVPSETEFEASQFDYVIDTLKAEPTSRRASIVLLQPAHLYPENTDVVCTYAINFTITDMHLHMTVMMRSNDVIFGFTNDAFCFSNLYMLVHAILAGHFRDETEEELKHGTYTHIVNSMHVYERHYKMIKELAAETTMGSYKHIRVPVPTATEAALLVASKTKECVGEYGTWLKS